jgi:hypothetical protein
VDEQTTASSPAPAILLDVLEGALNLIEHVDFLLSPVRWAQRIRRFAAKRRRRRMRATVCS